LIQNVFRRVHGRVLLFVVIVDYNFFHCVISVYAKNNGFKPI